MYMILFYFFVFFFTNVFSLVLVVLVFGIGTVCGEAITHDSSPNLFLTAQGLFDGATVFMSYLQESTGMCLITSSL